MQHEPPPAEPSAEPHARQPPAGPDARPPAGPAASPVARSAPPAEQPPANPLPAKQLPARPARVRILDAAHELMLTVGLARTTTKEIARAAGCSEAALYKYFPGKEELFIQVLHERLPRLTPLLRSLAAEPGVRTPEQNLTEIARRAALFYEQSFPIAASLYAETQLKRRHDEVMRQMGSGPHMPIRELDAYLRAERERGRIAPGADTFAAASLLLGACAQRAFAYDATATGERPPVDDFARRLARTLLAGLGGTQPEGGGVPGAASTEPGASGTEPSAAGTEPGAGSGGTASDAGAGPPGGGAEGP